MATKRNKNGQFVKGKGSSSPAKRSKAKGKGEGERSKGVAKRAGGLSAARAEYMLKKPAAGDSQATAIKKLQYNQDVIAHGLTMVIEEVAVHRRALVGAGLIASRGGAA